MTIIVMKNFNCYIKIIKSAKKRIILLTLMFAGISCDTTESNLFIDKSKQIFPLAVGNKWEYQYDIIQNDSVAESRKVNVEVTGKTKIRTAGNNVEVFIVKETTEGIYFAERYFYYSYEEDGLYNWQEISEGKFIKSHVVKYPVEKGESWRVDHGDYAEIYTCLSTADTVQIKDNQYICIVIRTGNGVSWYADYYYSVGTGLVQLIAETPEKGKTLRIQKLTDYLIN
ncbi:MAG: hypothetical protein ACOYVE_10125 [Melioribacter sp.]|uniref:hypothetical protein n=1 Tax=Melioribacter sp. TaxID=2052167 RepID=UPI003BE32383